MGKPEYVELDPEVSAFLQLAKDSPFLNDKFSKAKKAIKMMREVGPSYQGFCTHAMQHLKGPGDLQIWNSYVENAVSNAWRMYWVYRSDGGIYIVSIGPHTHTPGSQPEVTRKGKIKDS
ncbi:hypothetical protein WKY82_09280 [Gordonia malaquae]|uniref:hypothetical protein n=1 Tax=Gordonia malaquae TaxID=410332 RepID=UPI0030C7999E